MERGGPGRSRPGIPNLQCEASSPTCRGALVSWRRSTQASPRSQNPKGSRDRGGRRRDLSPRVGVDFTFTPLACASSQGPARSQRPRRSGLAQASRLRSIAQQHACITWPVPCESPIKRSSRRLSSTVSWGLHLPPRLGVSASHVHCEGPLLPSAAYF